MIWWMHFWPNCGSECDLTDPRNSSLYPAFFYNEDLTKRNLSERLRERRLMQVSWFILRNIYCNHWLLVTWCSRLPDQKLILSRASDYFTRELSSIIILCTGTDVHNVALFVAVLQSCKPKPKPQLQSMSCLPAWSVTQAAVGGTNHAKIVADCPNLRWTRFAETGYGQMSFKSTIVPSVVGDD